MMQTILTVVHIFTCVFLVLLVLLQSGKGAEISTSLGGSSQTIFGSSGGANFFTRLTAVMATIFMSTSLILTLMAGQVRKSLFEETATAASADQLAEPMPMVSSTPLPSAASSPLPEE